jgi:hypothetical protein
VEDAVAAGEGGAEAVVAEKVGAAEGEPLLRSLQGQQVSVLAVRFRNESKKTPLISSRAAKLGEIME